MLGGRMKAVLLRALMVAVGLATIWYCFRLGNYTIAIAYLVVWLVLFGLLLRKQSRERGGDRA
jgi:hypothetical protein